MSTVRHDTWPSSTPETAMCTHTPRCPDSTAPDREAARLVAPHPEQGWSLLCNGVVVFDDGGDLLPDGTAVAPHGRLAAEALPAA